MKKSSENTSRVKRAKRARTPKHKQTAIRAYGFLMEVSAKQSGRIWMHVGACWRLRNNLVQDRTLNRNENKLLKQQGQTDLHYLNRSDQYESIPEYVRRDTALSKVHSQVRQNVACRVEDGYQRFFDAIKEGNKNVHPPKYIDSKKYRSITYPQYGTAARIHNSTLILSGIGEFRLFDYRKIKGRPKTITVKFKQGKWWCIVTVETQEKDTIEQISLDDQRSNTGLDTGLSALLTDAQGNEYDPPKSWYDNRKRLRTAQKKLSRQFEAREKEHVRLVAKAKAEQTAIPSLRSVPISNRLKSQIKVVAKVHTRIENIRDHHHKKNACIISNKYQNAAIEEHPVGFMIRNKRLAKAASDRAIHKQKLLLKSKLGSKRYIPTPNRREGIGGNSQTCTCDAPVPKELKDRLHECPSCGLVAKRDHVSANIVSIIAFGTASVSLSQNMSKNTESGQDFGRRGEDKAVSSESSHCEPLITTTSESPRKRQSPVHRRKTTGAEATVAGKTRTHYRETDVAA